MSQDFLTVEDVAARLQLHVKTVRHFLKDGRLKGTRIGKQYRIARDDLNAFTGQNPPVRRQRQVEISSVVHIDAIGTETANRATTHLLAALKGRPDGDAPARLDTVYDEERARLKIIISAGLETTAHLLKYIAVLIAE
ncbi:MAG TPA: helix-turn-helix domain-containing protein [Rhizomicrobium sp.]|nr:helix-turn-helix domain-containing protein [Rhizomicrobium sp.]